MIETYYICFDWKAFNYALAHFKTGYAGIMKSFTKYELKKVMRVMKNNKGNDFYSLRYIGGKILKAEVKDFEVLTQMIETPSSPKRDVLKQLGLH